MITLNQLFELKRPWHTKADELPHNSVDTITHQVAGFKQRRIFGYSRV